MKMLFRLLLIIAFFFLPFTVSAAEIHTTDKLITVDTAQQKLFAWENGQVVYQTSVSTGLPQTPTVKGTFRIYWKLPSQNMRGYSRVNGWYYHPNVQYVMYFYQGYGIHSAYWHNNFGTPMSNGCVNVPLGAAEYLYSFAPYGTQVVVF